MMFGGICKIFLDSDLISFSLFLVGYFFYNFLISIWLILLFGCYEWCCNKNRCRYFDVEIRFLLIIF